MGEQLYFAYGSNMNLDQMEFRCPDAEVAGNVRLEDYRLGMGLLRSYRKRAAM